VSEIWDRCCSESFRRCAAVGDYPILSTAACNRISNGRKLRRDVALVLACPCETAHHGGDLGSHSSLGLRPPPIYLRRGCRTLFPLALEGIDNQTPLPGGELRMAASRR